jgi:ArsR family transcriptional regulator
MTSLDDSAGLLGLLADPTRMRLLALLEREELTVAELVSITGLTQSRVSTHLGRLRDAGMLRVRPSGASAYHALNANMPEEARGLWQVIRGQLSDAVVESDGQQCQAVVRARVGDGGWVDAVAGEMERHYSPGRTWESFAHGLIAFATLGDVLDVGSGDGFVANLLAPRARTVTCVDRSERMIAAARSRLEAHANVRFAVADMNAIPFDERSFDQVALFNVLTYSTDPASAVAEAARVLRPGGTLAVLTLNAHAHDGVTAPYGHLQPGFRATSVRRWLSRAGLRVEHCAVVGRERRAPHFELLSASATKPAEPSARHH